jgi:hypothetical protein
MSNGWLDDEQEGEVSEEPVPSGTTNRPSFPHAEKGHVQKHRKRAAKKRSVKKSSKVKASVGQRRATKKNAKQSRRRKK